MTPADRDWFDTLVGVASALNTLVLLVLVIVLVPAVLAFTKSLKQLRGLMDKAYDDLKPLTENANRIAASVNEITETVRDEVKQVSETIGQATRGLHTAVASTERRLRDFGALMDVAQSEAERVVVSTVSTVHGVRAGASAAMNGDDDGNDDGDDDGEDLLAEGGHRKPRGGRPKVRSRRKRAG
ncbi:MAG: DUF948 domain-containing protein [Gemmatimonadota bacterium]